MTPDRWARTFRAEFDGGDRGYRRDGSKETLLVEVNRHCEGTILSS